MKKYILILSLVCFCLAISAQTSSSSKSTPKLVASAVQEGDKENYPQAKTSKVLPELQEYSNTEGVKNKQDILMVKNKGANSKPNLVKPIISSGDKPKEN